MPNVDSRMSRSAAKPAATHAKTQHVVLGSSSQLFVRHAAVRPEFRLSRSLIVLFTAVSALQE